MTLAEWSTKYNEKARIFKKEGYDEAMLVSDNGVARKGDARWDLFHLTDYVVSSVTGGTIWLMKRK